MGRNEGADSLLKMALHGRCTNVLSLSKLFFLLLLLKLNLLTLVLLKTLVILADSLFGDQASYIKLNGTLLLLSLSLLLLLLLSC